MRIREGSLQRYAVLVNNNIVIFHYGVMLPLWLVRLVVSSWLFESQSLTAQTYNVAPLKQENLSDHFAPFSLPKSVVRFLFHVAFFVLWNIIPLLNHNSKYLIYNYGNKWYQWKSTRRAVFNNSSSSLCLIYHTKKQWFNINWTLVETASLEINWCKP